MLDPSQCWTLIQPPMPPAVHYRALGGGMGNATYVVATADQDYVLRCHNPELGDWVDREAERQAWTAAAQMGLAPPLCYWDPDHRFSVGAVVMARPARMTLEDLLDLVCGLHQLPVTLSRRDYRQTVARYLPEDMPATERDAVLERVAPLVKQVEACGLGWVPCHHDLVSENRLLSRQGWMAVDFEYACEGLALVDLAIAVIRCPVWLRTKAFRLYVRRQGRQLTATDWQSWSAAQALVRLQNDWWYQSRGQLPTTSRSPDARD